jgi:hypothetical protein
MEGILSRRTTLSLKTAVLAIALPVTTLHFSASVLVGPRANEIFQQRFDTGWVPTGADATLVRLNSLLSIPVPTVLLNVHPSRPAPLVWWIATGINSAVWGVVGALGVMLLGRLVMAAWSIRNEGGVTTPASPP